MLGTLECKENPCRQPDVWGLLYTGCWGLSPRKALVCLSLPPVSSLR